MHEATKDVGAEEFYLDAQVDGKLTFGAIEVVERRKPIGLTNLAAKSKQRERVTA
jgi:hypothetical protein